MHPRTLRETITLATAVSSGRDAKKSELVLCPPYPFIPAVTKAARGVAIGAQDSAAEEQGPYTGEVSPSMLASLGVSYVILGHSERRAAFGEDEYLIRRKVETALRAGLRVVLCVGEPLPIRKKGFLAARAFVRSQLSTTLRGLASLGAKKRNLIVTYEPVWAISTSNDHRNETPEDAARMIGFIKSLLRSAYHISSPRVLYGGSVNAKQACEFLSYPEIDGALVGGASLNPGEFKRLVEKVFLDSCATLKR